MPARPMQSIAHSNREQVQHLLGRLDDRERRVIHAHFGLGSASPATYEQVAEQLGPHQATRPADRKIRVGKTAGC